MAQLPRGVHLEWALPFAKSSPICLVRLLGIWIGSLPIEQSAPILSTPPCSRHLICACGDRQPGIKEDMWGFTLRFYGI